MKYIVLVADGMADHPIKEIGDKTPLEVAHTDHMDYVARHGFCGLVQTVPAKFYPGSEIANLAILGYDPNKYFTGRAPLEAANLDIDLADDEIAFRCNFVTVGNDAMNDYSAGHITTKEAGRLINDLNKQLKFDDVRFVAGKSYRHLMILKTANIAQMAALKCTPPHDIMGKKMERYFPQGKGNNILIELMQASRKVLESHPINQVRIDLKENPANMIWLWGQGTKPNLPSFYDRFGVKGSVISAVDLINGIGRLAGLDVIKVPGVTGYYDTNYSGKAQYALKSLKKKDFVYIHVEAPDEAGHNGDLRMKIACIERIDREIVGPILEHFKNTEDFRFLILPDHATPVEKRTHTRDPVCFAMIGKGIPADGASTYTETAAQAKGLKFKSAESMMEYFMKISYDYKNILNKQKGE